MPIIAEYAWHPLLLLNVIMFFAETDHFYACPAVEMNLLSGYCLVYPDSHLKVLGCLSEEFYL